MLGKIEMRTPPGGRPRDGRHCDLCGCSQPAVRCDKCGCQIFCLSCDDMYHRHPKRRFHLRKAVDPTPPVPQARPVLPLKVSHLAATNPGDPSKMPLPPPRKKKSIFGNFKIGTASSDTSPPLPKKEYSWTDRLGSIKKFMSNRPLPPLPNGEDDIDGIPAANGQSPVRGDLSFIHKKVEEKPPQLPQRSSKPSDFNRVGPDKGNQPPSPSMQFLGEVQNGTAEHTTNHMSQNWGVQSEDWNNRAPVQNGQHSFGTLRPGQTGIPPRAGPGFSGSMHQSSSATDLHNIHTAEGIINPAIPPHYPHYPMNPHMPPHYPYPMYPQYPNYPQYFGNSFANLSNQLTTTDGDMSDQSEASSRHPSKKQHFRRRAKRSQSVLAFPGQFYPFGPFPGYGPWGAPMPMEAPPSPAGSVRSLNRTGRSRRRKKLTSEDDNEELSMSSSPMSRPMSSSSDRAKGQRRAPSATQITSSDAESDGEEVHPKNKLNTIQRRVSDPPVSSSPVAPEKKTPKEDKTTSSKHAEAEAKVASPSIHERRPSLGSDSGDRFQVPSASPPALPANAWECRHCTFINPSSNRICQVCCRTVTPVSESPATAGSRSASAADNRKPSISSDKERSSPERRVDDEEREKKENQDLAILNSALDEAEKEISRGLEELKKLKDDTDNGVVNEPEAASSRVTQSPKPVYKSSGRMRSSILDKLNINKQQTDKPKTVSTSTDTQTEASQWTTDKVIEARRYSNSSTPSEAYNSPIAQSPELPRAVLGDKKRVDSSCQTQQQDNLFEYLERKKAAEEAYLGRPVNNFGFGYNDRFEMMASPAPMFDRYLGGGYGGMMQRSHSRASLFAGRLNDPMEYGPGFGYGGMYRSLSRGSLSGEYPDARLSELHNLRKPDYYLSMEELVERRRQETMRAQGLELVRMIREAEQQGFTADDIQVALTHCGKQSPMEWLQENWRNMVDSVVTLSTNYGNDKKENDIGLVSENEARDALRLHKGNIWAAVTECVEGRQRKYLELTARGKFSRKEIVDAMNASEGDVEMAYAKLSKTTGKPFLMRIWGSGEGVQNEDGAMPDRDDLQHHSIQYRKEDNDNMDYLSDEIWSEDGEVEWGEEEYEDDRPDLEDLQTCHEDLTGDPQELRTPESDKSDYCDAFADRNMSSPSDDIFFVIPEAKQEKKKGFLSKLVALRRDSKNKDEAAAQSAGPFLSEPVPAEDVASLTSASSSVQPKTSGALGSIKSTISAIKESVKESTKGEKNFPCFQPERRTIIVRGDIGKESLTTASNDNVQLTGLKKIEGDQLLCPTTDSVIGDDSVYPTANIRENKTATDNKAIDNSVNIPDLELKSGENLTKLNKKSVSNENSNKNQINTISAINDSLVDNVSETKQQNFVNLVDVRESQRNANQNVQADPVPQKEVKEIEAAAESNKNNDKSSTKSSDKKDSKRTISFTEKLKLAKQSASKALSNATSKEKTVDGSRKAQPPQEKLENNELNSSDGSNALMKNKFSSESVLHTNSKDIPHDPIKTFENESKLDKQRLDSFEKLQENISINNVRNYNESLATVSNISKERSDIELNDTPPKDVQENDSRINLENSKIRIFETSNLLNTETNANDIVSKVNLNESFSVIKNVLNNEVKSTDVLTIKNENSKISSKGETTLTGAKHPDTCNVTNSEQESKEESKKRLDDKTSGEIFSASISNENYAMKRTFIENDPKLNENEIFVQLEGKVSEMRNGNSSAYNETKVSDIMNDKNASVAIDQQNNAENFAHFNQSSTGRTPENSTDKIFEVNTKNSVENELESSLNKDVIQNTQILPSVSVSEHNLPQTKIEHYENEENSKQLETNTESSEIQCHTSNETPSSSKVDAPKDTTVSSQRKKTKKIKTNKTNKSSTTVKSARNEDYSVLEGNVDISSEMNPSEIIISESTLETLNQISPNAKISDTTNLTSKESISSNNSEIVSSYQETIVISNDEVTTSKVLGIKSNDVKNYKLSNQTVGEANSIKVCETSNKETPVSFGYPSVPSSSPSSSVFKDGIKEKASNDLINDLAANDIKSKGIKNVPKSSEVPSFTNSAVTKNDGTDHFENNSKNQDLKALHGLITETENLDMKETNLPISYHSSSTIKINEASKSSEIESSQTTYTDTESTMIVLDTSEVATFPEEKIGSLIPNEKFSENDIPSTTLVVADDQISTYSKISDIDQQISSTAQPSTKLEFSPDVTNEEPTSVPIPNIQKGNNVNTPESSSKTEILNDLNITNKTPEPTNSNLNNENDDPINTDLNINKNTCEPTSSKSDNADKRSEPTNSNIANNTSEPTNSNTDKISEPVDSSMGIKNKTPEPMNFNPTVTNETSEPESSNVNIKNGISDPTSSSLSVSNETSEPTNSNLHSDTRDIAVENSLNSSSLTSSKESLQRKMELTIEDNQPSAAPDSDDTDVPYSDESRPNSVTPPSPVDALRNRFEGLSGGTVRGSGRPASPFRRMSFNSRKQVIALERKRDTSSDKPWFLQKSSYEPPKPTLPKKSIKQQLETERRVRKMVSDRKCRTYRKAEIVVQLMDMNFEEAEAIQAANECSTLEQAISYLQQECLLCTGHFPVSQIVSMTHCEHMACRQCIRAYFTVQIRDRTILDLLCPFCNEPDITDEDIASDYFNHLDIMLKKLVDVEIHELFQRKLRDRVLMKDPNFRWCSQCSSGFIAMPNLKRLVCPDCNAVTCASCRRLWEREHQGISCEAFAALKDANDPDAQAAGLAKMLTEDGIACPNCHFKYALAKGGCMHFRCIQCQHDFCSGCSRPFKMGKKCGVSEFCAKLGLHAHHPRNCLFYLRDKEPEDLQKLLGLNSIEYNRDPPDGVELKDKCQVMEQKETGDGMIDDICGKEVMDGYAGLCRVHYVEYLGQLVNKHKVDPIQIFDNDDLELVLRRANIRLPPRRYRESDDKYREKLVNVIEEELPLDKIDGS